MAFYQHYNGALTSGTKIASDTTGFVVPKGYAGVLGIIKTGAGSSRLKCEFPGSQHRFNSESVPILGGEIAVETRLYDAPITPCYWPLAEGSRIDVTPEGAESSTEGNICIVWGRSDEISQHPAIHWMHADITMGTTAENAILVKYPEGLNTLAYGHANGANSEVLYYRYHFNGQDHALFSTHNAVDAQEIPGVLQKIGEPVNPQGGDLYYGAYTTGHGAGAAGDMFFGFV